MLAARTEGTSQDLGTLPTGTRSLVFVANEDSGSDSLLTHIWVETPEGEADSLQYPGSVTGLRADVFWDRDPRGPVYQLLLDGQELQRATAISWFLDNLEPGSEHEVQVFVDSVDCDPVVEAARFDLPD